LAASHGRVIALRLEEAPSLFACEIGAPTVLDKNGRKFSEIRRRQEMDAFVGPRIDLAGGFMDPIPCGIERL